MKNEKEITKSVLREKDWYREKNIEMLKKIEDLRFLKRIFVSLRDFLNEKQ